ncbi:hypothetical protein RchiOBHm_Chr5g0072291 [Rosa chinensis]|uniref:Uncharacterized protein n=1 Tax=Rosa chinensis TaxID=74649 RepID=A0A2P6QKN0_ROSCH|nr:hypothetical protein RchiOBHm_Chr5g0072291 [Rosa chinensis]
MVDFDLFSLSGDMNISCHHARIVYDLTYYRFEMEVLEKRGCLLEGVLHLLKTFQSSSIHRICFRLGIKSFTFCC